MLQILLLLASAPQPLPALDPSFEPRGLASIAPSANLGAFASQLDGPTEDSIWDRLRFYAQGRQRAEADFNRLSDKDRARGRMRFRVGATYEITEGLTSEVRLSTRSDGGDARSPYWNFGNGEAGFDAAQVGLDRFYVNWAACSDLDLRFGKLPHAFAGPPIYSEFVWDQDLHPAGITAVWAQEGQDGAPRFDLRGAGYIAVEQGNGNDAHMLGLQANGWLPINDDVGLHGAISYSDWSNIGGASAKLPLSGNTASNGGFGILEGFIDATYAGGPLGRTQAFVQATNNLDDDTGEDSGFAVGLKMGKSGTPGDWNVFASAFEFDANALFAAVAQDDTPFPGTGNGSGQSGVLFGTEYTWKENVSLRLWALSTDIDANRDPLRVRFDLSFWVK